MSQRQNNYYGTSWLSLLGVAFIVLKLIGVIAWSWWWVTCPFWGGLALVIGFTALSGVVFLGGFGIREIYKAIRNGKRRNNNKK